MATDAAPVACTMSDGARLRSTWRRTSDHVVEPEYRAATMYVSRIMSRASRLVTTATDAPAATPTVITAVALDAPRAATTNNASSNAGNATNTVATAMTASSIQRRDTADATPAMPPITIAMVMAKKAVSRVVCPPCSTLLNTSRPSWSVPKMCCSDGRRKRASESTARGSAGVQTRDASASSETSDVATPPTINERDDLMRVASDRAGR